jgi:acetate kinase
MAFTPAAGLVMGTRPGDMDPGLLLYIMRLENFTPDEMEHLVNSRCGLAGVSNGAPDMRELLARRSTDSNAREAVDLYCYSAKKYIGAFAAALGGVDTLVFSGGIGENSSEVRSAICDGLQELGIRIDEARNAASEPLISPAGARTAVRVIATDEESVMARIVSDLVSRSTTRYPVQEGSHV